jgi:transcriptional regulator NrdR family protein
MAQKNDGCPFCGNEDAQTLDYSDPDERKCARCGHRWNPPEKIGPTATHDVGGEPWRRDQQ